MDVEGFVSCFAPDGVTHDPVGTPCSAGHDAIRGFITHIFSAFDIIGLTEDAVFVSGNSAAVKWTGKGIAKNGNRVTFEGIDVIDCNDEGKIVLVRAFWNPGPVFAAIG